MTIRLEASAEIDAPIAAVWDVLIDWTGQSRWIPMTTVRVTGDRKAGLGTRVEALSGVRLGRIPLGLLDRFIVTGWSPPVADTAALEVLHLGPYFTGEGAFRLTGHDGKTTVSCIEAFALPGGRLVEWPVRLALPALRGGLTSSLRALGEIVAAPR
ncbi:MAG TPA: SRPBCC family protein [Propionibacteriaceae bacterium]|nr:SRPBCC family protein [Propionibacteriaceae bacterium]